MVRTSTFTAEKRFLTSRMASIPRSLGIEMSRMTILGGSVSRSDRSSRPSPASPATSRSATSSMIFLSPCRNRAWSSASTMRYFPISCPSILDGEAEGDPGSLAFAAPQLIHTAHHPHPLVHGRQADPSFRDISPRRLLRIKALTIVFHRKDDPVVKAPDADGNVAG